MSQHTNLEKKLSLKEFVEENYRLLAIVGVFGGLTTLFTRLENAEYLATISFVICLLLSLELYATSLKYGGPSLRMAFFEYLLAALLGNLAFFLILTYSDNLVSLLVCSLPILLGGSLLGFIRKSKSVMESHRVLMYSGFIIASLLLGMLLGAIVSTIAKP